MQYAIREAKDGDRAAVVRLHQRSQAATNVPDPRVYPPERLGDLLYGRPAVERWLAVSDGQIIGHGLIERLTAEDNELWQPFLAGDTLSQSLVLGGAFVDPDHAGQGLYTALFSHRLARVRAMGRTPLTATWSDNEHLATLFKRFGGREVGDQLLGELAVRLFAFEG